MPLAASSSSKPHPMAKYRSYASAFDFAVDLEKAAESLALASAREAAVAIALSLHRRIVDQTPVRTGCARANWFLSEGAPRRDTTTSVVPEPPPALTGDSPIYLTNSLPYIVPLEYGHSSQAPHGMIRVSISEIQAALAAGGPLP